MEFKTSDGTSEQFLSLMLLRQNTEQVTPFGNIECPRMSIHKRPGDDGIDLSQFYNASDGEDAQDSSICSYFPFKREESVVDLNSVCSVDDHFTSPARVTEVQLWSMLPCACRCCRSIYRPCFMFSYFTKLSLPLVKHVSCREIVHIN